MASMFPDASNFTIAGGSFTINQTNSTQTTVHTSALDKLSAAAAHSALHDAPARTDESRCHQHTRINVLDHLERWAQSISDEGASIFWLHGAAGAGKSAVMQTLAERCASQRLALGSFFFFRSDSTRNSAEVLIPTLVYQLGQSFSSLLDVLGLIMDQDPLIFKKSFQVQLRNVLVPALHHLLQLGIISDAPQSPRVFLIDGLDECIDPVQQQAIIHAIASVCHEFCIPVKFLIASRRELMISTTFERYKQENHLLGAISLSDDADAQDDVRRFITDEFLQIRLQHPFKKMIPVEWPDVYDINRLVWKSSSHFIYASTVMKYIWSVKENPARSLQVILGLEVSRTISPFSELDALYHHIIGSAAHRGKVLQILAHYIYMLRLFPSATIVSFVLNCSQDDLLIYMADISPLLVLSPLAEYVELPLQLLHASLGDFLADQSRSGSLYVNKQVYLASKLERCFHLFDLCSQQRLTMPDRKISGSEYRASCYLNFGTCLVEQIIATIAISGRLHETEDVLMRYSLRNFHQWQLRFRSNYQYGGHSKPFEYLQYLSTFLLVVHRMETPNAVALRQRVAEDFFDILESYMNCESRPLASAIVTLAYSGYSTQVVDQIMGSHFYDSPVRWLLSVDSPLRWLLSVDTISHAARAARRHALFPPNFHQPESILRIMAVMDSASVYRSINTSPERLAAAAEAMLEYLTNPVNLQFLSMNSRTHKSWLLQTKPGKHNSAGAPRLASPLTELWVISRRQLEHQLYLRTGLSRLPQVTPEWHTSLSNTKLSPKVLGPKYCTLGELYGMGRKITTVACLLEALLWLLPKVGFSEKIVLYSKRSFPWKVYERNVRLCRRVCKSLEKYAKRVQNEKLEELGHRIANGDGNALIEKSRMLYLDAQD